ncbi:hypothetical protein [Lentibacillus amyloliquefaciens]|uniref:Uncharacterized protein n=1 Tax=Lentibacillus amyloliquefaciens TaxID=1472767 RepID=A0A0U4EBR9_9BACI|nr:hypothetical protein [Lentibacillus amyloliquefaciens]ALX50449.1 hypothetical protein AOX59_18805 [Lentibacillus amyloliquefaciens]
MTTIADYEKLESKIESLRESNKKWNYKYRKEAARNETLLEKLNDMDSNHSLIKRYEHENTELRAEINQYKRDLRKIRKIVGE